MNKIFTILSALLLICVGVLPANADSISVYVSNYYSTGEWVFAQPFDTEFEVNSDGSYTMTDFFNSGYPVSFTFDIPKKESEISAITFVGNINRNGSYVEFLTPDDDDMCCVVYLLGSDNGIKLWYPTAYEQADFGFVEKLSEEEAEYYGFDYYCYMAMYGVLSDGTISDWYYLYFYFNILDSSEENTDKVVKYELLPVSVYPADGSTLESLSDIVLTFSDVTYYYIGGSAPNILLYRITNGASELVQSLDIYDANQFEYNDYFNPKEYTLHFDEVTAIGEYQIIIPQDVFIDEEYDESMGEKGNANPEIILNYTIEQELEESPDTTVTENAQEITVWICDWEGNEIADSYTTFITANEDGSYTIGDFLNSGESVSFTFVEPEIGQWNDGIEIISPTYLPDGYTYLFIMTADGQNYVDGKAYNLDGVAGWTTLESIYVAAETYSGVHRYDISDSSITYEYYAAICTSAYLEDGSYAPWLYVCFNFNKPESEDITIEEVVKYELLPDSVYPADGSTLEFLDNIELTFSDYTYDYLDGVPPYVWIYRITDGERELVQSLDLEGSNYIACDDWIAPKVWTLYFEEVMSPGDYQIVIKQGIFCDDEYAVSMREKGNTNPEIILNYTICGEDGYVKYELVPVSINPADGSTLESISDIVLTFSDVTHKLATSTSYYYRNILWLYKCSSDGERVLVDPLLVTLNSNVYNSKEWIFSINEETSPGDYQIVIKQGIFCDEEYLNTGKMKGNVNPEIILNYTIRSNGTCQGVEASYNGRYLTLRTYEPGAEILYSFDPEESPMVYNGPFDVEGLKTVYAYVSKDGYTNSDTLVYTIEYYADENHAIVSEEGTLELIFDWMGYWDFLPFEEYSVSGSLDDADFEIVRQMYSLRHLNLTDVVCDFIPRHVFEGKPLISISLPSEVREYDSRIFDGCTNLLSIVFNGTASISNDVLYGVSNPNLLIYVMKPDETEINLTRGRNMIKGDVVSSIELSDGYPFYASRDFTANKISYTRNFSKVTEIDGCSGWESLTLPFDVQTITDATGEVYPFAANSGDRRFWLYEPIGTGWNRTAAIEAYNPYIIAMPNHPWYVESMNISGDVEFSAENALVAATPDYTRTPYKNSLVMIANYTPVEAADDVYVINDEAFGDYQPGSVFVSGTRDARPFEGYLTGVSSARHLPVFDSSEVESLIGEIGMSVWSENKEICIYSGIDAKVRIHDLVGQLVRIADVKAGETYRVSGLNKGVYLVGNKKLLVK